MYPANIHAQRFGSLYQMISLISVQELLHEHADDKDKTDYVSAIIKTIISTGRADDFIIAICEVSND